MLKAQLIGNLGTDAEVREYNGSKFVTFKVANSDKYTGQDGVTHESLQWVSVTWNGDGGKLLQYLKKGVKVFVTGSQSVGVYSSAKERRMLPDISIRADYIELCGGSSDDVPRRLVDDAGTLLDVYKCYYIDSNIQKQQKYKTLTDGRGSVFDVDKNGIVRRQQQQQQQAEQPTESK